MNRNRFLEVKAQFLEHLRSSGKSWYTYRSYASDLTQFAAYWQHLDEQQQRTHHINDVAPDFITSLHGSNADAQSIARKCSCLNSFKKFARSFDTSITFSTQRPPKKQQTPATLSRADITYLLDTLAPEELNSRFPYRDKAILELLYATGIKASELVRIRMKDIYLDEYTIYIPHNHRYVFFGRHARQRLLDYLQCERPASESPYSCAFLNYQGTPLTTRSLQRICHAFQEHLSTHVTITPHVLRHSFALHLLEQGADKDTVQRLLGNKTRLSLEQYMQLLYELD